jgi:hypothetical protein
VIFYLGCNGRSIALFEKLILRVQIQLLKLLFQQALVNLWTNTTISAVYPPFNPENPSQRILPWTLTQQPASLRQRILHPLNADLLGDR